jgi:hypothetical protein
MDEVATEGESTDDGLTDKGLTEVLIEEWLTDTDGGMTECFTTP